MLEDEQAHATGQVDGAVRAVIVHQNADVHQIRQFSYRDLEGLLRVVGRHYYRDALAIDHETLKVKLFTTGVTGEHGVKP
jgi:hypothetical protein